MLKSIELKHVGLCESLKVEFDDRLNVIVGDNGLGKSFVLDLAWWILTRTWAGRPARAGSRAGGQAPKIAWTVKGASRPSTSSATVPKGASPTVWKRAAGRPPMVGLTIYARVDGGYSVWDPARNYWWVEDEPRLPAFHFSREEVWQGREQDGEVISEGLIADWRSWQQSHDPEDEGSTFGLFEEILEILSPEPQERMRPSTKTTRSSENDARRIPMLSLPYGDVSILHASAAMQRVLALAYLLVWTWEQHRAASDELEFPYERRMVLLIDEVEAHLHPRWQRRILPAVLAAVKRLSPELQVQVVVTTHSPLVLASLEASFDEARDQLLAFSLEEGKVRLERLPWANRGDVTGWLESEVFGVSPRSAEAEEALAAANALLGGPKATRAKAKEVQEQLTRCLPAMDPFWATWRFGLRRLGVEL